jgi:hypothetical protein
MTEHPITIVNPSRPTSNLGTLTNDSIKTTAVTTTIVTAFIMMGLFHIVEIWGEEPTRSTTGSRQVKIGPKGGKKTRDEASMNVEILVMTILLLFQ